MRIEQHLSPHLGIPELSSLTRAVRVWIWVFFIAITLPSIVNAMGLSTMPQGQACVGAAVAVAALQPLPEQATQRIPDSVAAAGGVDVAWAWLGSPTLRYPHRALGSPTHAASVHALVRSRSGSWQVIE